MINWHTTVNFIKKDWNEHPLRLCLESINWLLNLTIATLVAVSVPITNWLVVYPIIFCALAISTYSSISRGSFGILMTTLTLFIIDGLGYYRVLML